MATPKPPTFIKLSVKEKTPNFSKAVAIVHVRMCQPRSNEICIKNKYVGINASDVNCTAARYFTDKHKLPFDCGFEGLGEVVEVGDEVTDIKVGQTVTYLSQPKAFAEYSCIPAVDAFLIPEPKPEYLALVACGMTAAMGLDKAGRITEGKTVLITAAAGGTGHLAVQWAKAAGCHVIGTCSSEEKMRLLKSVGCDRVINYKEENLSDVLSKDYPNGIDVIWETIGGEVFETLVKHLATKGRLLIIGGITGYKKETKECMPKVDASSLPEMLLFKSAAVEGFLLLEYKESYQSYFKYLSERFQKGEITVVLDTGKESQGKEFTGIGGIITAVEHLQSGKSMGKVVARIY